MMRLFETARPRRATLGLMGVLLCGLLRGQTTWDPGKNPDPQEILNQAQEDARAGRYADAEVVGGRRVRMQDRWTDVTPDSHTLTALYDSGNGVMTPYVVSRTTRQKKASVGKP